MTPLRRQALLRVLEGEAGRRLVASLRLDDAQHLSATPNGERKTDCAGRKVVGHMDGRRGVTDEQIEAAGRGQSAAVADHQDIALQAVCTEVLLHDA